MPLERQRSRARNAALINIFATPGLGSLLARRWVAGGGQLLLAVTGFALFCTWFGKLMQDYYGLMFDLSSEPSSHGHLLWLKWGVTLFAVAWAWSLVSSISIVRSVPKSRPGGAPVAPMAQTPPPARPSQPPALPPELPPQ